MKTLLIAFVLVLAGCTGSGTYQDSGGGNGGGGYFDQGGQRGSGFCLPGSSKGGRC